MLSIMRLVIVLTALACSAGCVALAVGGAAAGGYVVGKDERPVGQIIDDGAITTAVKTRLIRSKYVDAAKVDVDTYQGIVTLSGRIDSYVAREQAEALAAETRGVKSVINQLEVNRPPGN